LKTIQKCQGQNYPGHCCQEHSCPGQCCPGQPDNLTLLVLVPHRDARLPLRNWSETLFTSGFSGAWSFPWVIPLALLKNTLTDDELKTIAYGIRQEIDKNGGKFRTGLPASIALPGEQGNKTISIYGTVLDFTFNSCLFDHVKEKIMAVLQPPVIGAAVYYGSLPDNIPPPPQISFRSAALANMGFYSISGSGNGIGSDFFKWCIGKLFWLPKTKTLTNNIRE